VIAAQETAMTVERAVRALAGGFVLTSLALGWWVHPGSYRLASAQGKSRE
jgi:hypothetical protein